MKCPEQNQIGNWNGREIFFLRSLLTFKKFSNGPLKLSHQDDSFEYPHDNVRRDEYLTKKWQNWWKRKNIVTIVLITDF